MFVFSQRFYICIRTTAVCKLCLLWPLDYLLTVTESQLQRFRVLPC